MRFCQLILIFIGDRRRIGAGSEENPPVTNYRLRNQYMVDHADCLLAVYDNDRNLRSGTMQTVNYARRRKLQPALEPLAAVVVFVIFPLEPGWPVASNGAGFIFHIFLSCPSWDMTITGIRSAATGYLFCVSTARRLSSPEVKKILP